jgi:hypothetical protein
MSILDVTQAEYTGKSTSPLLAKSSFPVFPFAAANYKLFDQPLGD